MTTVHSKSDLQRRVLWISLLLPAGLGVLSGCGWAPKIEVVKREATTEPTYYLAEGEKVEIELALDQLGVLPAIGSSREQLDAAAKALGLAPAGDVAQQFLLYRLDSPTDRRTLEQLARKLQADNPGVVDKAGLVVKEPAADMPMLVTDEVIVQLDPGLSQAEAEAIIADNGAVIVRARPYVSNLYVVRLTPASGVGFLEGANRFDALPTTEYAHPNFIIPTILHDTIPNDPLFENQWHLRNTGRGEGTADADADVSMAWDITQGSREVVIAVIEPGEQFLIFPISSGTFDTDHEDLRPNLWTNPRETSNGIDDDANGYVDDIHGWDFLDLDLPSKHATAVAGVAAARGDNMLGVSGAAPRSRLMTIGLGRDAASHAEAFDYAAANGAAVINNSWGYVPRVTIPTDVRSALDRATTTGRGGLGAVVLFAMGNTDEDVCVASPTHIAALPNVIGVSASSNQDRKVAESGWGNCMDVLAPTHRGSGTGGVPYSGTLNITTTDLPGRAGYNDRSPVSWCPSPTSPADRNYTDCFGGTSSSSPLAAGVAALVLAVRPELTRLQVQRLLQDTSDKIEDSAAAYSSVTGFSTPSSGAASHGYGRINAFDAVRIVAPFAAGGDLGRAGVDIFMRDNRLDWGNTEQPSNTLYEPTRGQLPHWESVDIKIDKYPYRRAPTTSAEFDAFADEESEEAWDHRVYVRVRNRGPVTATDVTVKLHWTFAGTAFPELPTDFWARFPADSTDTSRWHPLGVQSIPSLPYSGASVAATTADAAQIVAFDFRSPSIDFSASNPRHYCLMAVATSAQDPVSPRSRAQRNLDWITTRDNNVTHRNVVLHDSRVPMSPFPFYLRNPSGTKVESRLRVVAPQGWKVISTVGPAVGERLTMKEGEERLVVLEVTPPAPGARAEIQLIQERLDFTITHGNQPSVHVMGGITLRFAPGGG